MDGCAATCCFGHRPDVICGYTCQTDFAAGSLPYKLCIMFKMPIYIQYINIAYERMHAMSDLETSEEPFTV